MATNDFEEGGHLSFAFNCYRHFHRHLLLHESLAIVMQFEFAVDISSPQSNVNIRPLGRLTFIHFCSECHNRHHH
jgi:hypothetical protein